MPRPKRPSRGKPLTQVVSPAEAAPLAAPPGHDVRRYVYAGLDLLLALVHAVIAVMAPTRHASGQVVLWGVVLMFVVAAFGALLGRPLGRRLAIGALATLLVIEVLLLILIVSSAAFLAGVFGAFGTGGAVIALVAGLLSIQTVALVPALELKYLMTRAGRRAFAVPSA